MDNAESVVGADFLLHAVQVVLRRLFGKAEVIGDFLVGEAFGDERDELLLAAGQPQAQVHAGRWEAGGFALDVAEQHRTERAGTNGFAGVDGAHGLHDVLRGSVARR